MNTVSIVASLTVACVVLLVLRNRQDKARKHAAATSEEGKAAGLPITATYRAKPLLSPWELKVFGPLRASLPAGWYLCPQVRAADIVSISAPSSGHQRAALGKLAPRSVDFVLIDEGAIPRLVVELDDSSHDRPERRQRDADIDRALHAAGVPVWRIRPGQEIDWEAIVATVADGAQSVLSANPSRILRAEA